MEPMNLHHVLKHWKIILVELILIIITIFSLTNPTLDKNSLLIAVIAPLTGEHAEIGKDVVISMDLFAERINKYGGIQGKKLLFKYHDNRSNVQTTKVVSNKIALNNKYLAVIAGFNDATTKAATEIFELAEIPIISPLSHLTTDSNVLFQISPSYKESGVYIAHYIKEILNKSSVSIIYSNNPTELDLIKSFKQTFISLGGNVEKILISRLTTDDFNDNIESNNILLFTNTSKNAADLIADLKRNQFKSPIMSLDTELANKLALHPEENKYLGFLSNGIYIPSILLLDSINIPELALVKKDYKLVTNNSKKISNSSIATVLSAKLITDTLKNIKNKPYDNSSLRKEIIIELQKNIWFDKNKVGLATNLFFGIFRQHYLISAAINPTLITIGDLPDLSEKRNEGKSFNIDWRELYKTDFIYTGIAMNEISDINVDNLTYTLDFFLWFRHKNNLTDVSNIEFLNTVEPTTLRDLLAAADNEKSKYKAKLVGSHSSNGETYHRYQVKARFKTEVIKNYVLGQQNMFVKFRHSEHNLFKLNYVSDFINANNGVFSQENNSMNTHLIEDKSFVLNYNAEYLNTSQKTMLGSPESLNKSSKFSEFIAEYRIKASPNSFRGIASLLNLMISGREDIINISKTITLLAISFGLFIIIIYIQKQKTFERTATILWSLQGVLIFSTLLLGELALSEFIYHFKYLPSGIHNIDEINVTMVYLKNIVAMLWWIIPAYYITSAFEQLLWRPIEIRTETKIPNVLRLFIIVIVYALAGLGILSFVLKVTVTSLAATSGVIAIVFALASKIDLSNIIAGLGISFAKTIHINDWVKINDVTGRVVEMTPRSTKLLTTNSSLIIIPNTTVATSVIENYNRPNTSNRLIIPFELVPVYRFERVEKILLDAAHATKGVLEEPAPFVVFKGQGDSSQKFELAFFIDNYAKRGRVSQAVWRSIWRHLEQADIAMATPQREIFMPKITTSDVSDYTTIINNCGVFEFLSNEKKEQLSQHLHPKNYNVGEIILTANQMTHALFIIIEGAVIVEISEPETQTKRLGVADIFGNLNLLNETPMTGIAIAKTSTAVLMITTEDFIKIIETTPSSNR